MSAFMKTARQLELSTTWFLGNAVQWLHLMETLDLASKPVRALEIGCWEGLSTYFLASKIPHLRLDCVDTWSGGDEHKAAGNNMLQVEDRFDANLAAFRSKITKHKMLSSDFFKANPSPKIYDFIYVDGSHYADDVFEDANKAFSMLKVGGILIFDDLLWQGYDRILDNPAAALMCFLQLKRGGYEVLHLDGQLVIRKTRHFIR